MYVVQLPETCRPSLTGKWLASSGLSVSYKSQVVKLLQNKEKKKKLIASGEDFYIRSFSCNLKFLPLLYTLKLLPRLGLTPLTTNLTCEQ